MAFFKHMLSKVTGKVTEVVAKVVTQTLGEGLAKTRAFLTTKLRSLILGRTLDEALIGDVERMLLEADVGTRATAKIIQSVREDYKSGTLQDAGQLLAHLKRGLKAMLASGGAEVDVRAEAVYQARGLNLRRPGELSVILVTGINGAGKTTSIAKLCKHLKDQGRSVMLGAADTFRAGAVRQLEIWGERLGVEVVKGKPGADPAAVAFDAVKAAQAKGVDVLIVDTAGRLQTQDPLMRELAKIKGVLAKQVPAATAAGNDAGAGAAPHETILVLDATTGQNALRQAEEFGRAAGVTGIFLAKLDGTAKGGVVVAIRSASAIPVLFVGTGETPEAMAVFDPDAFVEAMFEGEAGEDG
jgi:fused signal recognition particle receptor